MLLLMKTSRVRPTKPVCPTLVNKKSKKQTVKEYVMTDPLSKPKDEFNELVAQLSSPDSPVGIDAKYTHAVIIDYLRQISARLDALEVALKEK